MLEHVHFGIFLSSFLAEQYCLHDTIEHVFEQVQFCKILILKSASHVKKLKEESQFVSYSQMLNTQHTKMQRNFSSILNKLLQVKKIR